MESKLEKDGLKKSVVYIYDEQQMLEYLEERKLIINQEINEDLIQDAVLHVLKWNKEDKGKAVEDRKPIIIYCNSPGGSVVDGYALIDTIQLSQTPIYTVNLGMEYSMGFLIGISGHKRYSLPTATFLLHDGSSVMYNSMAKLADTANFYKDLEKRTKEFVLAHSNLTSKVYDKKYGSEWYMFAKEAKANGFVDFIIGEDCSLDDII
jgi:ATP-dependent Clp protease protease subunit